MYTAAESSMFPAGVLPRTGWLFQCRVNWQCGHSWSTVRNVPIVLVRTSHTHLQIGHNSNSSIMQDSCTIYFLVLCGAFDTTPLSRKKEKKRKKLTHKDCSCQNIHSLYLQWSRIIFGMHVGTLEQLTTCLLKVTLRQSLQDHRWHPPLVTLPLKMCPQMDPPLPPPFPHEVFLPVSL